MQFSRTTPQRGNGMERASFDESKQSACQPLAVRHKAAAAALRAEAQTHLKSRALLRKRCYRLTAARLREGTSSLSTSPSALRGGDKKRRYLFEKQTNHNQII